MQYLDFPPTIHSASPPTSLGSYGLQTQLIAVGEFHPPPEIARMEELITVVRPLLCTDTKLDNKKIKTFRTDHELATGCALELVSGFHL